MQNAVSNTDIQEKIASFESMTDADFSARLENIVNSFSAINDGLNACAPSAIRAAICRKDMTRLDTIVKALPASHKAKFLRTALVACGGYSENDKGRFFVKENALVLYDRKNGFTVNQGLTKTQRRSAMQRADALRYTLFSGITAKDIPNNAPLDAVYLRNIIKAYEKHGCNAAYKSAFADIIRIAQAAVENN